MDPATVARLLRSLAIAPSRRGVARGLAGCTLVGALSPLLGAVGPEDAAAKCVKPGKKCKKKHGKKQKCCVGAKCQGKKCTCPESQIAAGGQCVTGQGTCVPADLVCASTCNGNPQCVCHKSMAGAIRCGDNSIQSQCGECTTDADCTSYGPGSFCAREEYDPGACAGCAFGEGFCRTPCPT